MFSSTTIGIRLLSSLGLLVILSLSSVFSQDSTSSGQPWQQDFTVSGNADGSMNAMTQDLGQSTQGFAQWIFGPLMLVVIGILILAIIVGTYFGGWRGALTGIMAIFVGTLLLSLAKRFLFAA